MSKTIDQRVVEMRFDNKHFEQNVRTTMSTLEKFKQKLNLTGASKGLENVNSAAKKVDMKGLGSSIEAVSAKFSALDVIGVTTLANLTNSAVNAGKKMVKALTIEPIMTGFSEYETQINAVQTILANTQSKGSTLEDVNSALDELNTYADKTIYNFTEMTRNIGTFTAAGVDLDKSVTSIKGIANLAAVSGSTSQQASTAMYQLSQALAAGKVQLMDWNSVVNAGMGGQVFQDALKRTATQMGHNVDEMIAQYGSFRESLTKGEWLTAEVLTETLTQLSGAYTEADLIAQGYTESQAKEITELAETAVNAATKVKTFSQLWDTMKEAVQSGWTQTWEIIIGDFEESKSFLTKLSDTFGEVIGKSSDKRNQLLEGALGNSKWSNFIEQINQAGISTEQFNDKLKETAKEHNIAIDDLITEYGSLEKVISSGKLSTDVITETLKKFVGIETEASGATEDMTGKLEEFQAIVDAIWQGDFGNGEDRIKVLTDAGYDYSKVQELVNNSVDGHRLTLDELSDTQLENIGYTKEQITAIRKLATEAEKTGTPIHELIEDIQKPTGRDLLIESVMNVIKSVGKVASAVGQAWRDIFEPVKPEQLYSVIEAINEFSNKLIMSDDTADKLRRTLKGLFAIIDIITTIAGNGLTLAFKIVNKVLGMLDTDILSVTAAIGDILAVISDWIDGNNIIVKSLEIMMPYLKKAGQAIREWASGIKDADDIPKYIIEGLVNGLREGVKLVGEMMTELGKAILDKIKSVLGIHSPSTEFFEIGTNIIEGLVNGIQNGASIVWETIKNIGQKCLEVLKNIDFGAILATGLGAGIIFAGFKILKFLDKITSPLEGLNNMFESVGDMCDKIGDSFKAKTMVKKSEALLNIAKAIAILAATIIALSYCDMGKLSQAVGLVTVLSAIMIGLIFITDLAAKSGDFKGTSRIFLAMSASILIISIALKQLSKINPENALTTVIAFGLIMGSMVGLMFAFGKFTNAVEAASISKLGSMLIKMAMALLIMVGVIKVASKLDGGEVAKGLTVVAMIELLFVSVIAVSKMAGQYGSKAGSLLLKMSFAMLIMVGVIKVASELNGRTVGKGLGVVSLIGILFAGIIAVSKLAGKNGAKAGTMLLLMSGAMLIMTSVIKQIAKVNDSDIEKSIETIAKIEILFAAIILVSKYTGQNAIKAGAMLLLMSGAILILTAVLFLISKMDASGVERALGVITQLGLMFGVLIAVTKLATDCKGTLITLSVVIGLLVAAIAGLTFLDPNAIRTAANSLTLVISAFSILVAATHLIQNAKGMWKPLIALSGVVLLLALILGAMAIMDAEPSIETAACLAIMLDAMALALLIAGLAGKRATKNTAGLYSIAGVVAIIAGILSAMDALNVEPSMETVEAISVLLGAMAATLLVAGLAGARAVANTAGLYSISGVVAIIAGILSAMDALNVQPSIETAGALSILLNAMAAALLLVGYAGPLAVQNTAGLYSISGVVAIIAVILGLMDALNIEPSIETALSLSILLTAMAAAFALIAPLGPIASGAGPAILALDALIINLGALLIGIGALMDHYPKLEEWLNEGIPILEKIGYALGSFFGNIIGGFIGGISDGFVEIGTNLSKFMDEAKPFFDGIKNISENDVNAVKSIASMILTLTATDLITGISSALGLGDSSFSNFGSQLADFGEYLKSYAVAVEGIDSGSVKESAEAAKALADFSQAIPNTGGWLAKIVGDNTMSTYGADLAAFGGYLKAYADEVKGLDAETVKASGDAVKGLVDIADSIPNTGGWLAKIVGDNTMSTYGADLAAFGGYLKAYADEVKGLDAETVKASGDAVKGLVDIADSIPNTGGWLAKIVGDNTMSTYGADLAAFGGYLKAYAIKVAGIDVGAVAESAKAVKKLVALSNEMPTSGSWWESIFGSDDMSVFGDQLESMGTALKNYSTEVASVSSETIGTSVDSIKKLIDLINGMVDLDGSGVKEFQSAIKRLGNTAIAALVGAFSDSTEKLESAGSKAVNNMLTGINSKKDEFSKAGTTLTNKLKEGIGMNYETMTNAGKKLSRNVVTGFNANKSDATSAAEKMVSNISSAIAKEASSLNTAGGTLMNSLTKGMNSKKSDAVRNIKLIVNSLRDSVKEKYDTLKSVGATLISKLVSGMKSKKSDVKTAAGSLASAGVSKIRDDYYDKFKSAGKYVVTGFAAGITENTFMAEATAKAMAQKALQAAQKALGIASPSKEFYKIGDFAGQGFINALGDYESNSYAAGSDIANSAKNGLSAAIAKMQDYINGDMDTQPTIRPVLDLSDIEAGANNINSLFRGGVSLGLASDVGVVSAMMNGRIQNGGASDVVSAIDKLRKDLGNINSTTNYINGVTYDDGSNITNAVKDIVRAARIERRA